jgi:hypothetical protein
LKKTWYAVFPLWQLDTGEAQRGKPRGARTRGRGPEGQGASPVSFVVFPVLLSTGYRRYLWSHTCLPLWETSRVYRETGYGALVNAHNNPKPQAQELQATTTSCPLTHNNRAPSVSDRPRRQDMEAPWRIRTSTSVWLKRTMRDLEMEREVHGHPPPVIFVDRAEMHVDIPAIPAPAGMPAPTPNTGGAYVRQSDGTPELKRSIKFTPSVKEDQGQGAEPVTVVRPTNPVTQSLWGVFREASEVAFR